MPPGAATRSTVRRAACAGVTVGPSGGVWWNVPGPYNLPVPQDHSPSRERRRLHGVDRDTPLSGRGPVDALHEDVTHPALPDSGDQCGHRLAAYTSVGGPAGLEICQRVGEVGHLADHGVRPGTGQQGAHRVGVVDVEDLPCGAHDVDRPGPVHRTGGAHHLVTSGQQRRDQLSTDHPGRTDDEYAHGHTPRLTPQHPGRDAAPQDAKPRAPPRIPERRQCSKRDETGTEQETAAKLDEGRPGSTAPPPWSAKRDKQPRRRGPRSGLRRASDALLAPNQ